MSDADTRSDDPGPPRRVRAPSSARERVRARLASPSGLRDAFLVAEVLARPVSLREPDGRPPGG